MCPVPGLVAPLPPPQCYGTPPSHQKSHIPRYLILMIHIYMYVCLNIVE